MGDTSPDRLAEGAATGRPTARSNASAVRPAGTRAGADPRPVAGTCAGTRTASVSSPAPASSATGHVTRRGSTSVSGPGQNRSASSRARGGASTWRNAASASG